jgi:hypothetical protein
METRGSPRIWLADFSRVFGMACFVALHDLDQCDPSHDPATSIMIDAEHRHGDEDRSASDRPLW